MKKKFLGMGRPSASMVVAVAALGVGLAGGASAASGLITGADIQNGSITGADIKNASVRFQDLAPSTRAKLHSGKGHAVVAGPAGAAGAKGDTGAAGVQGIQGTIGVNGVDGKDGVNGFDGKDGVNGQDGVNPAVAVTKSGDAGWAFTGNPAARLAGGELRLAGGFDSNTVAGGIGMTKGYDSVPLSSLSALSYSLHVTKRPNDVSAPTIHVAVVGAETGTTSGFMNLVYEPYNNGSVNVGKPYTLDAFTGKWWGTRATPNHPLQATASLASFVHDNPNAKIVAISLDNGGTSGPGTIPVDDFAAGADNLVVGTGADFTRYDFGG